jgi:ankyrin repeat protein
VITPLRSAMVALLLMASFTAAADDGTDFFRALLIDDYPVVRGLLQKGMDPNWREPERKEPALVQAIRTDADRIIALLLASPKIDLEAKAANGDTALMLAAYKGKLELVRTLLEKKAEPNKPGWTPLHYAASAGHVEIVALLLDRYAYIDADSPNRTTPLMMAARDGHEACVKLLLEEGADSSLSNEAGLTALDFAKAGNQIAVANMLIEHKRKGGR